MRSTFLFWKAFGSIGTTLAFTLLAAVASGVLFGLAPALQVPAYKLREGLQDAGRESSGSRRHGWFRDGLVVSQFALACVLLVGAALLIQSFLRVLDVNLGFQPERAAALRIDPGFRDLESRATELIYRRCVASRPVSPRHHGSRDQPMCCRSTGTGVWQVSAKGQVYEKDHHPEAFIRVVSDGYFEALGIALKSGREFTESDRASSEPVVMVNETLARTLWPGQDAVGQMVTQDGGRRVVGVVADVHHGGPERSGRV